MSISIIDGETTVLLPSGLQWQDEFQWSAIEQTSEYSIGGALVIQEGVKQTGRPITLFGGSDGAWITRSQLIELRTIAEQAGKILILNLWGQVFNVMFTRPPIVAEEIMRQADPGDDHFYSVTVNLIEVEV